MGADIYFEGVCSFGLQRTASVCVEVLVLRPRVPECYGVSKGGVLKTGGRARGIDSVVLSLSLVAFGLGAVVSCCVKMHCCTAVCAKLCARSCFLEAHDPSGLEVTQSTDAAIPHQLGAAAGIPHK